jgi:hypothetical protein
MTLPPMLSDDREEDCSDTDTRGSSRFRQEDQVKAV